MYLYDLFAKKLAQNRNKIFDKETPFHLKTKAILRDIFLFSSTCHDVFKYQMIVVINKVTWSCVR